jgi:indolepyruvate ferredoxin oxidoreductase beta subunit
MSTRGNQAGGMIMNRNTSNSNILIAGVGGQGVLTLAEILAKTALSDGLNVRVGEIHGMAQRGGHVVCTVRIGEEVYGPIIDPGTADLIIGFEPLETLREAHIIGKDGYIVMSSHIQYPVAVSMGETEYPKHDEIISKMEQFTKKILEFDAMELAKEAGSSRSMNMVMLGAAIGTGLTPLRKESALDAVRSSFSSKFESINVAAVELGYNAVKNEMS